MTLSHMTAGSGDEHSKLSNRNFGFVLTFMTLVIGSWPLLWGLPARTPFFIFSLGLLILAALFPKPLHWPKVGWMAVTARIAKVVTFLLLAVIFLLVILPVGVIFRIIGRDIMLRKFEPKLTSYWVDRCVEIQSGDLRRLY